MHGERIGALDGLRGVAVAAVVLFHTGASWAKGGFLGVSLFFTLSGYLIASRLLSEHQRSGTISLGGFWGRRFRRLWPAAVLTVFSVWCINAFSGQFSIHELSFESIASVLSVANWWFLADGTSYQDLFQAPSPFLHFWSLAIEEQFYIFFPLVVFGCLRRGRSTLIAAVVGLYALSATAQILTSSHDAVYFGTHTRISEILTGVVAALWVTSREKRSAPTVPAWLPAVAPLAAVATVVSWVTLSEASEIWSSGGFLVVGVLSAVLALAAGSGTGLIAGAADIAPLRWLGLRSYGIYLFHWPIFVMWSPNADGDAAPIEWAIRIAATFVLAEVSYRLVEMPIRTKKVLPRHWWPTVAGSTAVVLLLFGTAAALSDPPVERFELLAEPAPFVPPSTSPQVTTPGAQTPTPTEPTEPLIAVFGDSTAAAAADGLLVWSETTDDALIQDVSRPSCPISEYLRHQQSPVEQSYERKPECKWRGKFEEWFAARAPEEIAVIGGTSEIVDFEAPDIGWTNITEPVGRDFIRSEFEELAGELRAAAPDALLVITTAPYNDWLMCQDPCLTHDRGRFDLYNELAADLVSDGTFDASIDYGEHINSLNLSPQDPMRPDGVHLSEEGSLADATNWLGPALVDQLR